MSHTLHHEMDGTEPLLDIRNLTVRYGAITALEDVSLTVYPGQMVSLIGANGAGKSTLLRTISGLVDVASGTILFRQGDLIRVAPHQRARLGIAHVPEGRGVFANLTVAENLKLATYGRRQVEGYRQDLDRIYTLLPKLAERRSQMAGSLSGGEQQMLAVARAMLMRGDLLLLDEPSMGLAPVVARTIFELIASLAAEGTTILLVEQNARAALRLAQRGYVLENGRITLAGNAQDLLRDPQIDAAYLGAM